MTEGSSTPNTPDHPRHEQGSAMEIEDLRSFSDDMKIPAFAQIIPKSPETGKVPMKNIGRPPVQESKKHTNEETQPKDEQREPVIHAVTTSADKPDIYDELEKYKEQIQESGSHTDSDLPHDSAVHEAVSEQRDETGGIAMSTPSTKEENSSSMPLELQVQPDQLQLAKDVADEIPLLPEESPDETKVQPAESSEAHAVPAAAEEHVKPADLSASETGALPISGNGDEDAGKKFSDEIFSIKREIDSILERLDSIESLKAKLTASGRSAAPAKDRVESLGDIPLLDLDDEGIPELDADEHEESGTGFLKGKDRVSIKKEVDSMLENIRKVPPEKEIGHFGKLIRMVPALHFLKPRFSDILGRGETDPKVLLGLYRIAVRFLQEDLEAKEKTVELLRSECLGHKNQARRLADVLGGRGDKPQVMIPGEDDVPQETLEQKREKRQRDQELKNEYELKINNLTEELEKKTTEMEKLETRNERLQDDFNNYRNRQNKEISLQVNKAREDVMLELLKVIDNMERALEVSKGTDNLAAVIKGFTMIYDQYISILKKFEMVEIPAQDLVFDPYVHEAVAKEESFMVPEGTVIAVLRKGYMLGDKVLRAAQVKTSFLPPLNP